MNCSFRVGATMVMLPRFTGEAAIDLMLAEDVTVFHGVPTMYIGLLAAAEGRTDLPRLRLCVSGGASLPTPVLHRFEEVFDTHIYEGYGLSETSPSATTNQPHFGTRPGTVGHPIWGVEVEIARPEVTEAIDFVPDGELGEIVIRGHNVFSGYLGRPEATAAALVDGWFRTGDLGRKDDEGFVTIVDRVKDVVIRGGFNVYPSEVEDVLARHPAVAQVAVIGIPDEPARRGDHGGGGAPAGRRVPDRGRVPRLGQGEPGPAQVSAEAAARRGAADGAEHEGAQARTCVAPTRAELGCCEDQLDAFGPGVTRCRRGRDEPIARQRSGDAGDQLTQHGHVAAGAGVGAEDLLPVAFAELGIGGLAVHQPVHVPPGDDQRLEVVRESLQRRLLGRGRRRLAGR